MQINFHWAKGIIIHPLLQKPDKTKKTPHPWIAPIHYRRIKNLPLSQSPPAIYQDSQGTANNIKLRLVHGQDVLKVIVSSINEKLSYWGVVLDQSGNDY